MNKIPFQNNTVIPPEWLNAIQNLSYEKEPGEVGYIPNPDDVFHFQQWRTFTIDENDRITLGDYQRNVIIVPSAKDQNVTLDHFPTNGLIIYAPDWDAESESTAVTIVGKVLNNYKTLPVIKGGVGIFLCSGQLVISRSLISDSALSLATLKRLYVDELIVMSTLTLPASSILSGNIANSAVTTDKIGNGAVTMDKIGNGSVSSEKIPQGAVTTDKINTYAVETIKIKDKAVTSEKLADQLAFVKTPKFPRKNYLEINVTESAETFLAHSDYDGYIFSTGTGSHTITVRLTVSSVFQEGDTYRIYNNSHNVVTVRDDIDEWFTTIPAWTFKDFYYTGLAWELA